MSVVLHMYVCLPICLQFVLFSFSFLFMCVTVLVNVHVFYCALTSTFVPQMLRVRWLGNRETDSSLLMSSPDFSPLQHTHYVTDYVNEISYFYTYSHPKNLAWFQQFGCQVGQSEREREREREANN